jgi:hypothetical protein
MDIRRIYEPYDARPLESGAVQKLYKFTNGYGASVVKGEHTYGGDEGLWELAVLAFNTNGDFSLCYTTPITSDVEGHLTDDAVEVLLAKVEALPLQYGALAGNRNHDDVHKLDNELHVRDFNEVRRGDKE